MTSATSSTAAGTGGVQSTTTASTPGSANTAVSAPRNSSTPARYPRSSGLVRMPAWTSPPETSAVRSASVAGSYSASTRPAPMQASAASTDGPHEFDTTATRRPAGTGWSTRSRATSKSCSRVSTRITPVWARSASSDVSAGQPSGSNWSSETARPLFTATTGLVRVRRRVMRAKLRGLPNDSRWSRTTSVSSSCSQYCSRSLPLTSGLLPTDTNVEMPMPRRLA